MELISIKSFEWILVQVWNIRCAVIISLCFQILLIFLAPLRKRSSSYLTSIIIWSAYLLADSTAIYAIASILNTERNCPDRKILSDNIAALWAPFMLLHLGGPDSITAFSLEDNELWIRNFVRLIVELYTVAYVCYLASPMPFPFWLAILLVFLAGTIKYGERTRSLYLASLGTLKDSFRTKPDAGLDYVQFMEKYSSMEDSQLPAKIVIKSEPNRTSGNITVTRHLQVIQEGFRFYNIFRGLIVDHIFSFQERNESYEFFIHLQPDKAFKIMEVELNFMYDELFTKMATLHRNCYGYILRFTCTALIVVVLPISLFAISSKPLPSHDVTITCVLLVGAIVLDLFALIKILFSDWTIARLGRSKFLNVIHAVHKMTSNQARWSERVSQHNLIGYSLKKRSEWFDLMINRLGFKSTYDELKYKYSKHVDEDSLKEFIFNELKERAQKTRGTSAEKEICNSRGKGAITKHENLESVKNSVSDVDYDENVLLWHIATDLLYFTLKDAPNRDEEAATTSTNNKNNNVKPDPQQICKILSDYMLYLIVMRPTMMSAIAGISQIRFQDTCAEAMRFFNREKPLPEQRKACEKLLSVNTEVKPATVKGDRSKSLLFDACILAKELMTIDQDEMWTMMSGVWLELICYGASHCKGNGHAQQLSKGGELITFVWLLMTHFGLSDRFMIETGLVKAKLKLRERLDGGNMGKLLRRLKREGRS